MAFEYKPRFGNVVDPKRCKASVSHSVWHSTQCSRKPHADGWCKQHHPDTEAAKHDEREARWAEERARDALRYARNHDRPAEYKEALRQIAAGHNDARALAAEVLAKWNDK